MIKSSQHGIPTGKRVYSWSRSSHGIRAGAVGGSDDALGRFELGIDAVAVVGGKHEDDVRPASPDSWVQDEDVSVSGESRDHWVKARLYPEVRAGGFTRVDGTIEFYQRIQALLSPEMTVLDFGAGRGQFVEDPVVFRRDLRYLRKRAREVIGVDVDDAVLSNPALDRALVIPEGGLVPLDDQSVDLIVSDFTFEHLRQPERVAGEFDRLLRPGGWICARTPNRSGYIGIGARLVPNRLHVGALRRLQPSKRPEDTFPTAYRLNTRRSIEHHFPLSRYDHCVYALNNEPAYFGTSIVAWRLARLAFRLAPERFGAMLYVFLRKRQPQ